MTVLVECKSRLFDVPYAYKQIGPERLKANKQNLSTRKGLVPVSDEALTFIMTIVPEREYVLPFESRLKAELERATKSFTLGEIQSEALRAELAAKFSGEESPLEWWRKHHDMVIVLD